MKTKIYAKMPISIFKISFKIFKISKNYQDSKVVQFL
jgi:hypothetical protein